MYIIRNILVDITDQRDLQLHVAERIKVNPAQISDLQIVRRSIDARKRGRLKFNFTVLCELSGKFKSHPEIKPFQEKKPLILPQKELNSDNPFIIGAGPAGLFAALALVEAGFSPYIFERGEAISERSKKVENFWENAVLDPESNVQFGLGGAGTFSDGKLTSRGKDFYINAVYDKLVQFGADPEIKLDALPHLGTDGVKLITRNLRKYLESKGCKFHFNSKMTDLQIDDGKVKKVQIAGSWYQPEILILAIGNAARDTFHLLNQKIEMVSKPFAVGFRIEHPQDYLNATFYGAQTDLTIVGPATYRLTAKQGTRGVYSFCMCPGGEVIGAATEPGQIVTNGMSYSSREKFYGNSAIVTSVTADDFGAGALAGMNFQRRLEASCFDPEQPYYAPLQTAQDFMTKSSSSSVLASSYRPMTYKADLNKIFPKPIYSALKAGLAKFERTAPGFIENGMLIAPETRTSSPVRMLRDRDNFSAQKIENLFPIGEGSGYAGGIVSSAADGYKLGKIFKRVTGTEPANTTA
ncbi:MAG: NAD(P)-binding protein [Candidatus Cloacimonadales bacterium]